MPDILNRRYLIENKVGSGGMGTVYRAIDKLATDQKRMVAVKRVHIPVERLTFTSQASNTLPHIALAQEFQTLASLRHPHIVSVLDYGFEQVADNKFRPYYTMELLENAQTITDVSRNTTFENKMRLIAQMLQALIFLHRRGILHRDLKPDNILVVNGEVRVMDFGLALGAKQAQEQSVQLAGTLAYLAPEILAGKPPTIQSDLYAIGLIIYEMLTGEFPYQKGSSQELLANIMYFTPNVSNIDHPQIADVVARLVTKVVEDRYEGAYETLEALEKACGLNLSQETILIRESFLQSSKLVGRDAEMTQLADATQKMLDGAGSAWLIGGESGVGKSRLMSETRTLGLVKGALVLRGHAVSEGGLPYHLWHSVLRWLTISLEVTDFEASVLKTIISDVDTLLNRTIDPAASLDPKAEQTRLQMVVQDLLIRQLQTQPLILLLEDLHWAGTETLDLLRWVLPLVQNYKLLILGNFRNDEKPYLPEELPAMSLMALRRLNVRYISELTQQILGAAGELPIVNALLYRETEGNVFFLVEVMRTLAEQVGDLSQIGIKTLPEQLFVGGIQEAIIRRLDRVHEADRELLSLAALVGRDIDVKLLKQLAPEIDVERWLFHSLDVAVLEWVDEHWTFGHDKLREGAIGRLSFDQKRSYHVQIAKAIEDVYGDDPDYVVALAYHWGMAQNNDKELFYTQQAGENATQRYATQEALRFLTRAYELSNLPKQRATLAFKLGAVHELIGDVDRAKMMYEEGRDHAVVGNDLVGMLEAHIRLADFWRLRGEHDKARILLNDGLDMVKVSPYNNLKGRLLAVMAHTYADQWQLSPAIDYYQQALALLSENQGERAKVLISLGLALMDNGNYENALTYLREALTISIQIGETRDIGRAINNMAGVYLMRGEYQNAMTCSLFRLNNALKLNDKRGIGLSVGNIGYALFWLREYEQVDRCYRLALQIAEEMQLQQQIAGYHLNLAMLYEQYFIYPEALSQIEEAQSIAQSGGFEELTVQCQIFDARVSVIMGMREPEDAIAELETLLQYHKDDATYQATVHFNIWRIDNTRKDNQKLAEKIFRQVYESSYNAETALNYTELTGEMLPPPPPLLALPDIVLSEKLDLDELLKRAELFIGVAM